MNIFILLATLAMADTSLPAGLSSPVFSSEGSLVYFCPDKGATDSFSVHAAIDGLEPGHPASDSGKGPVFQNRYTRKDGVTATVQVFRAAPLPETPANALIDIIIITSRNQGSAPALVIPTVTAVGKPHNHRIHSPFPFTENRTPAGKVLKFQGEMLLPDKEYSVTLSVSEDASLLLPTCLEGAQDMRRKTIAWWGSRDQKQYANKKRFN